MRTWLVVFLCWTALIAVFVGHAYLFAVTTGQTINIRPYIVWVIAEMYTWAALTPMIVWAGRRNPIESTRWLTAILANVGIAALFAGVHVLVLAFFRFIGLWGSPWTHSFHSLFGSSLGSGFHVNFATCAFILCFAHALDYYRRYRDRKLRTSQLEAALAQAQLDALRMQINPHFLFNTLNSISALIDDEPKAAHQMIARLGDFLRLTLKSKGEASSSVEQELQFLNSYLQIEQVRFGDRLKVRIDAEPDALRAFVPSLILQPIVENAFRHGLAKVDEGILDIRARRDGDTLELSVRDNGPGLPAGDVRYGVGLSNTRDRLQTQFGSAQNLILSNAPGGGLLVQVRIPYTNGVAK